MCMFIFSSHSFRFLGLVGGIIIMAITRILLLTYLLFVFVLVKGGLSLIIVAR